MFEKTNNTETHGTIWSGFESQSFALLYWLQLIQKKKKNCVFKRVREKLCVGKKKKKSFQHCLFLLLFAELCNIIPHDLLSGS